jgi:HEAT repeat protein
MRRLLLTAAVFVLCAGHLPAQSEEKEALNADEKRLKDAYQNTDDKSIAKFLSTRAKGEVAPKDLDKLIEDLDAKDAATRHQACQQLVAIGGPAVPKLRITARNGKDTAAELAKKVLKVIEDDQALVTGAAVRLLAARRPDGTAEALIAYVPHAENDAVMDELKAALAAVARVKDKPNPALVEALEDKHPLRRATAITALCAGGIAEPRAALRKRLIDESPSVRLRAALALAQVNDAKAVSTLIALLGDLPAFQASEADALLAELAGEQAPRIPLGDDRSRQKARDEWARWWLGCDGPRMLKEMHNRTLSEETLNAVATLIQKLGSDVPKESFQAEADLTKMGPVIRPLVRAATTSKDEEIRTGSRKVLAALEKQRWTPLPSTLPRLLALRRPKGVAEALLAYVPLAENESMRQEVQKALNAVTFTSGKANAAVVKALADKVPTRRAAAALALCSGPDVDHLADVRKRLDAKTEKDAEVRLRVALALAAREEKEAVPALIRLVAELPVEAALKVDDYLFRLARDNPPKNLPAEDKMKERSAAWQKWWDANGKNAVMTGAFTPEVRRPYLGYVLLIQSKNDQIVGLDRNDKVRVAITELKGPRDAQYLGDRKFLVAEYDGKRVTERDPDGKILWEKKLDFHPMQAERLRNGDTFIVGQDKIVQVSRAKREVLTIDRKGDVRTARQLPNGRIVILTTQDKYVLCDRHGKEIKTTSLPKLDVDQNEILDNGNVLVPLPSSKQIKEYTPQGKEVRSITFTKDEPVHAVQLSNDHLLVTTRKSPHPLLETDRDGKKVREHATAIYAFRIRGR